MNIFSDSNWYYHLSFVIIILQTPECYVHRHKTRIHYYVRYLHSVLGTVATVVFGGSMDSSDVSAVEKKCEIKTSSKYAMSYCDTRVY